MPKTKNPVKKFIKLVATVLVGLILPVTKVYSQNMITNSDFELGNVGFTSDYVECNWTNNAPWFHGIW